MGGTPEPERTPRSCWYRVITVSSSFAPAKGRFGDAPFEGRKAGAPAIALNQQGERPSQQLPPSAGIRLSGRSPSESTLRLGQARDELGMFRSREAKVEHGTQPSRVAFDQCLRIKP